MEAATLRCARKKSARRLVRLGIAVSLSWIAVVDAVLWWIYYRPASKELFVDEWQYVWSSDLVLLGRPADPNLIWPPGQATLLAGLRRGLGDLAPAVLAMQLWHTALSVLAAVLLADLARRASGSAVAGAAAGLLWLAHPSVLAFSQYLFVEPTFVALLLVALWRPVRFRERPRALPWAALGAGMAWGVSLLFKSAAAYAWPLWLVVFLPQVAGRPARRWFYPAVIHLTLFVVAGLAVTLPVRLANWRLHLDPIVADSSAFGLWVGLHGRWRSDAYLDDTGARLAAYLDSADAPNERRRIYHRRTLDSVAEQGLAVVVREKLALQPFRLLSAKTNLVTQLPGPQCRGHLPRYRDPPPALVAFLVLSSHAIHAATLVAFAFGLLLWPRWRRVETWALLALLAYFAAVFFVGHVESRYAYWVWPILCVFAGWFAMRLAARLATGAPVVTQRNPAGWRWIVGSGLAVLLLWFAFAGPHLDRMCT